MHRAYLMGMLGAVGLAFVAGGAPLTHAESEMTIFMETMIPHVDQRVPAPSPAARVMAVTFTAAYDAWAAYDDEAVGVVTGNLLDGTGGANTDSNRREAVLNAMATALYGLTGKRNPYRERMRWMGYNPDSQSPAAILGRRVGAAVLAERRQDGSNQSGAYEDTSHYMIAPPEEFESWQPDFIEDMWQEPLTPHWGRVLPFAVRNLATLRPPPPPEPDTPEFEAQVAEVLSYAANLTQDQMATAEYWAPTRWATPATQLIDLTKDISEREHLSFDEDVRLFFVVGNALLDASITAWDAKYHYNYVRPITVIQAMGNEPLTAYSTRHNRIESMMAEEWEPYLETPPFPEYVSGHSTFAAAWARVMELMMGTEELNYTARVYNLEERASSHIFNPLELHYPTYMSAAEASGMSRLYGGIHWMVGNRQGLDLGYRVGQMAHTRAQDFFDGEAMTPTPVFASVESDYWQAMPEGGQMSMVLDPVPAGLYAISASLVSGADTTPRGPVRISVRSGDGSNRVLGIYDEQNRDNPLSPWVSVNWRSTGTEAFYVMIEPAVVASDPPAPYEVVQIYQVRVN